MAEPRVIIVGAGPAGVRAAQTLIEAGLRPALIDESRRDGGQIYRRQPENFTRPYAKLYGTEAAKAQDLHRAFEALRASLDYRPDTLAWNISGKELFTVAGAQWSFLPFDALIIAAGATDRLMPVRGWNRAGVYSLGAAQIALKAQACAIGRNVVFLGTGPLLYLVASQYVKAGAAVAAVLDTSPFGLQISALPKLVARPRLLAKGLMLVAALRLAGVTLHRGVTPLDIEGDAQTGVTGVTVRLGSGASTRFACDAIGLGYHLRPESQLADLAGCEFYFESISRQWLPRADADGRASVPGIYLAGDGVRTRGADGAEIAGQLAAHALLADLGRAVPAPEIASLRREQASFERFQRGIAQAFPWPAQQAAALSDDTIVCRCETISAGELRHVARDKGASELNRAKAFSRIGMGRCQGRYCAQAAAEIIAAAANVPLEKVGRLRGQAPVKPFPLAAEEAAS